MDINQLNMATAAFLRQLRMFSERNSLQITEQSTELFMDVVQSVEQLIASAKIVVPIADEESHDFLLNLNEKHFDLRQYIICRMCSVSETELNDENEFPIAFDILGKNW